MTQVGQQRDERREPEHRPVGAGRGDALLLHELDAVGDELSPAVEGAGVHRAEPALHVGHHLVLGLAHDERQGEERDQHARDPDRQLQPERHGGSIREPGMAGRCRNRPGQSGSSAGSGSSKISGSSDGVGFFDGLGVGDVDAAQW